jgi:transketolase C-terminal domain/subunit
MEDVLHDKADITLYAISSPRFAVEEAAQMLSQEGIICNIVHIVWLKPFEITDKYLKPLKRSKLGLVIDSGFEICGAARSIAYELSDASGYPVKALGLLDMTKCLCPPYQNKAPDSKRICETVTGIIRGISQKIQ